MWRFLKLEVEFEMKIEVNYIFYTCVYCISREGDFIIIHPSRAMLAWLPRPDMASLAECAHHQFGPCTLLAADARPRRTRRAHSLRLPAPHNRYRDGAAPPGFFWLFWRRRRRRRRRRHPRQKRWRQRRLPPPSLRPWRQRPWRQTVRTPQSRRKTRARVRSKARSKARSRRTTRQRPAQRM